MYNGDIVCILTSAFHLLNRSVMSQPEMAYFLWTMETFCAFSLQLITMIFGNKVILQMFMLRNCLVFFFCYFKYSAELFY